MWQPTQYYSTKMQLTRMEMEGRMLAAKKRSKKRKTGSGPIMEKMRMLELDEEADDRVGNEADASEEWQLQNERLISETQSAGTDMEPEEGQLKDLPAERKKKKSEKKKVQEQSSDAEAGNETGAETEITDQPEHAVGQEKKDISVQMFSAEKLQDRMIWAEILGEPVSVKRRKKRMEQIYGNQGHAY